MVCVESRRPVRPQETLSAARLPTPDWCATDGIHFYVYRTESCGVFGGVLTIKRGLTVVGQIDFTYISYSYTPTDDNTWVHQIEIEAHYIYGEGVGSSVWQLRLLGGLCLPVYVSDRVQPQRSIPRVCAPCRRCPSLGIARRVPERCPADPPQRPITSHAKSANSLQTVLHCSSGRQLR